MSVLSIASNFALSEADSQIYKASSNLWINDTIKFPNKANNVRLYHGIGLGIIPFGFKPGLGLRYFFTENFGLNVELALGTPLLGGGV